MHPRYHRRLSDILDKKGRDVVTVRPDGTVLEAMRVLVHHRIGSVVVTDGDEVQGILTERDILRIGAESPDALGSTPVADAMTRELVTGEDGDSVEHAMTVMTERRIRHLPIVHDGEIRGMVSIGDLVKSCLQETEEENRHLKRYIQGEVR